MVKNPYTVLGISLSASDSEIRSAFRALAKKYHPDKNQNNPAAEEKFKEISRAFDILGDPDMRKKFDRGDINAEGKPADPFARQWGGKEGAQERARQQQRSTPFGARRSKVGANAGGPGVHSGPGASGQSAPFDELQDIFSDLFGGAKSNQPARGRDVRYLLDVDFLDALQGATKRVTMPDGRVLDLVIPAGLDEGHTLRLRGQGEPGEAGGAAGDVYVETRIVEHDVFIRDGADIHVDIPISLHEAVLGGKITVPTIDGDVAVSVPKAANTGTTLRLRGRGMKGETKAENGDQYVNLKIVLPDTIDTALTEFVANWKVGEDFNPRKKLTSK